MLYLLDGGLAEEFIPPVQGNHDDWTLETEATHIFDRGVQAPLSERWSGVIVLAWPPTIRENAYAYPAPDHDNWLTAPGRGPAKTEHEKASGFKRLDRLFKTVEAMLHGVIVGH
ncbi:MAG: hypothetical protein P3C10_00280 [Gemmatimonadota bacterium]|nr:hypothetical protein [Gemmatimonadota bacterium]